MSYAFKPKPLHAAIVSAIAASAGAAAQAVAAEGEIEEVIVTATKRTASIQDIPVAVQAVTDTSLDELGVSNFENYMLHVRGGTAGGSGPGQHTIYIRGGASTTPALQIAGVAGLAPNVALYLDEHPVTQPGRNLDVYAADLNRIEVLAGPQGTLFGANSQAGTVRLITNKPDQLGTYASIKLGTAVTENGEPSNRIEGMVNLPVNDWIALRGVAYFDRKGGYIDNVAGTRDVRSSARFRTEGTVRANGLPVNAARAGLQAGADLSRVRFVEADNSARTEDDFNGTDYSGFRVAGRFDIGYDWRLQVAYNEQEIDTEGVFFVDPELGDLEIQRYAEDSHKDEFRNTNWTLEGRLAALEMVYAGAYTARETQQVVDYSDYLFVAQYLPYYICDASVSYPGDAAPEGVCQAPELFVGGVTDVEVVTHELRFATDPAARVHATFGVFYSDFELKELNDFTYPGSTRIEGFGQRGFSPNFPFDNAYFSDPGPFPPGVIWRNDTRRTDEQLGLFGEVTVDLTSRFELTLGGRYYDIEVDLEGSSNSSFCNLRGPDINAFGTNISDLYDGDGRFTFRGSCDNSQHIAYTADTIDENTPQSVVGALMAPDSAKAEGSIFKVTASWVPSDDSLYYITWSEGFRPGLLNRPGGASDGQGFTVPFAVDSDGVTNIELGWKADLLGGGLRLNGNVFFIDVNKLQTTIFDPSIVNIFFSDNAADAEVLGLEADFIWIPDSLDNLTLAGAFSVLDTEIKRVITPSNDVREGDELAYAPSFQANIRARYEWPLTGDLTAHVMPHLSHSASSYSDIVSINRDEIDGWTMIGVTAGLSTDRWTVESFVDNLGDTRAELARDFGYDVRRVTYARPRTIGLRVSYEF